jgi:hypothetical protein
MCERTKLGLSVLGAALLLGAAGDALLRATPWGLNVSLWVWALGSAAFVLKRRARAAGEGSWALVCAAAFAAAFAWRDSPALRALNALAILALLSVALLGARGGRVRLAGATDYLLAGLASALNAAFAPLMLLADDISWRQLGRRGGWTRHAAAVLRGLVIAVPLVLVFGALFVAADAVYEGMVRDAFNLDADLALSHLLLFLALSWVSAGYLRGLALSRAGRRVGDRRAFVVLGIGGGEQPAQAGVARATQDGAAATAAPAGPDAQSGVANAGDASAAAVSRERAHAELTPGAKEAEGPYRTQPPSVTEIVGEGAARTPPSVVGEPCPAADAAKAGTTAGEGAAAARPNVTTDQSRVEAHAATAAARGAGGEAAGPDATPAPRKLSLGVVEVGVALGLLNALFFSFVFVQLRYFFGGAGAVLGTAGMTYSEYARRGFFELVWVAALVLPILLAAHWLLRKENPSHERLFRALAGGLLVMLFVVMASAVGRMRLYQSEYGQTELRFYTTAFMGWLASVFVWFALTVLRGARERFACGALVSALAVLGTLNAVNPNALIVRANAEHARGAHAFDAAYATSLGADAAPALLEAAPSLRPEERAEVARRLLGRPWEDGADWRSWNLARARARRLLRDSESSLREWARPVPAFEADVATRPPS